MGKFLFVENRTSQRGGLRQPHDNQKSRKGQVRGETQKTAPCTRFAAHRSVNRGKTSWGQKATPPPETKDVWLFDWTLAKLEENGEGREPEAQPFVIPLCPRRTEKRVCRSPPNLTRRGRKKKKTWGSGGVLLNGRHQEKRARPRFTSKWGGSKNLQRTKKKLRVGQRKNPRTEERLKETLP